MIDPKNLRDVMLVLKEFGVTQFKSDGIEVHLGQSPTPSTESVPPLPTLRESYSEIGKVPFPTEEPVSEEIKHKVDELTSLLKLNDNDLLDRLFPDHTQTEEVE